MVVALLLQLLTASYLRFEHFDLRYLDLVLIVVVYSSFGRNPMRSMLLGAGAGLVQDTLSAGILGTQSFSKTIIGFLSSVLSVRFALDRLFPRLVVIAGASLVNALIYLGLHALFGIRLIPEPVWENLPRHLQWHVVANVLGAVVVFRVLDWFVIDQEIRRERRPGLRRL